MIRKGKRRRKKLLLALMILVALILIYGCLIEPRRIELTTYQVTVPNLPPSMDGFRVVQLGDIHRRIILPDGLVRGAVDIANSTHADIVVLSGDYVGYSKSDIEPCIRMLSRLQAKYGVYAVLGNHDYTTDPVAISALLKRHKIRLLSNSNTELIHRLHLVGIEDEWFGKPDVNAAFEGINPKDSYIMVAHNPLTANRLVGKCGLLISGHTHGGQVIVPQIPNNEIPGLIRWGYLRGWHKIGNIRLYVNRGIGMGSIPLRIGCRPEVTLYILKSPRSRMK